MFVLAKHFLVAVDVSLAHVFLVRSGLSVQYSLGGFALIGT